MLIFKGSILIRVQHRGTEIQRALREKKFRISLIASGSTFDNRISKIYFAP